MFKECKKTYSATAEKVQETVYHAEPELTALTVFQTFFLSFLEVQ